MEKYKLRKAEPLTIYKFNSELVFRYATVLNVKRNVRFAEVIVENEDASPTNAQKHNEGDETRRNKGPRRHNSIIKTKELSSSSSGLGVCLIKLYIETGRGYRIS